MATIASVVPGTGGTTTPSTQYPQAIGRLVLETAAVLKVNTGAVYYIRPITSSTQETRIKSSSTLEITA